MLVILAIIAGSTLSGLLDGLIAFPTAAALRVFVKQVITLAIRQQMGAPEHREEPAGEDHPAAVKE